MLFFSGGGRPWVPELCLNSSAIMLSYFVNTNSKTRKPDSRLRRVIRAKRKKRQVKK